MLKSSKSRDIRQQTRPSFYNNVIMGTIASLINSHRSVYSTLYSDADERKHQSSAWLFPVNSPHKWPITRKMFPFDDVIMIIWINGGVLLHRPPLYCNRMRGINHNRLACSLQQRKNIKANYESFVGNWLIITTKDQQCEKRFQVMMSTWITNVPVWNWLPKFELLLSSLFL